MGGWGGGLIESEIGQRRGEKDRWRREAQIGLPADKIVVCFRFPPRLNWTRGLRGNQS